MNEDLVLHILNTACYGLNLHFSIIPQAPYLYVFFDRSPEAVLDYGTLTETLRLAAVSAGLPPEYEYLALYSRILGEEHPDWETAIYLYQSTIPEVIPQAEQVDEGQDFPPEVPDASEPSDHAPDYAPEYALPEAQDAFPIDNAIPPQEVIDQDVLSFEELFGSGNSSESLPPAEIYPPFPQDNLSDEFQIDPTIVFDGDLPNPVPSTSIEEPEEEPEEAIAEIQSLGMEPLDNPLDRDVVEIGAEMDAEIGADDKFLESGLLEGTGEDKETVGTDDTIDTIDQGIAIDIKNDKDDIDDFLDLSGPLPLPPPPPRHPRKSPNSSQMSAPKTSSPQVEEDMSQYYFRAKAKPKATASSASPVSSPTESPILSDPQPESSAVPPSAPAISQTSLETVSTTQTVPLETVDTPDTVKLSSYCFIRNKLMLSSTIKLPSPEVIDLIAKLHLFAPAEKMSIAPLLDKLYRQPEKNDSEDGAGEAVLYQPGDINLDGLVKPIQDWMQGVLALEPESFRKSAIWFSRYCYNPAKTIAELGITLP